MTAGTAGVPHLPGPVGRTVRLALGIVSLQAAVGAVLALVDGVSGPPRTSDTGLVIAALIAFWLTPSVFDVGLGTRLGNGWRLAVAGGIALSAAVGLALGAVGTGFSIGVLVWVAVTLGWLGVAFLVAVVLRTPGCEMRALQHLASVVRSEDREFVACPGPLQPLDEWEARTTGRAVPYAQEVQHMRFATPAAHELVAALDRAAGLLDEPQRRVALATYRLLADRAPVAPEGIAKATGINATTITSWLDEWPGVFRDPDGRVVGFWGLALSPLSPRYELVDHHTGEVVGYAWCAWDTLFLPALLGRTLDVTAADGLSGATITLTVAPDGVRSLGPANTVVSFQAPTDEWDEDILTSFCHKVLFFADGPGAEAWMAERDDDLFTLSAAAAFDIGRRWVTERYGDALLTADRER